MKTINHDGDNWEVWSLGVEREDGKVMAHLASTTRSRQQANGQVPCQIQDWIDPSKIED